MSRNSDRDGKNNQLNNVLKVNIFRSFPLGKRAKIDFSSIFVCAPTKYERVVEKKNWIRIQTANSSSTFHTSFLVVHRKTNTIIFMMRSRGESEQVTTKHLQ